MPERFNRCLLTGAPIKDLAWNDMRSIVVYTSQLTGPVQLGALYAQELLNLGQFDQPILAGYFRNKYEAGLEPAVVTKDVAERIIAAQDYPLDFEQRAAFLLRFLYDNGGKEYRRRDISSSSDYPLCYAMNGDELIRIMSMLQARGLVNVGNEKILSAGRKAYMEVTITPAGFEKVVGDLPAEHLTGLIRGRIQTGQPDLDAKVNHAHDLFHGANGDMEQLRSACITLAAVLERYRGDLSFAFGKKDTDAFFALVNEFDIRHNHTRVKQIEHPEQLEWVYYTLLNSISTYCKLKARDAR